MLLLVSSVVGLDVVGKKLCVTAGLEVDEGEYGAAVSMIDVHALELLKSYESDEIVYPEAVGNPAIGVPCQSLEPQATMLPSLARVAANAS